MRIALKEANGKGFTLRLPSRLLFNYAAALIVPSLTKKHGLIITRKQSLTFVRVLNRVRHKNHGWKFLECETHDGQRIEITL